MKKIKFRGETLTGEVIYCEPFESSDTFEFDEFCDAVNKETLVQMLGVDADGVEVYEGDVVVDEFGNETPASFITLPLERLHVK